MDARDRNLGILSSSLWLTTLLLLSSLKLSSHVVLFYYGSIYSLKLFRVKLFGSLETEEVITPHIHSKVGEAFTKQGYV
jgi:hypothetical protein